MTVSLCLPSISFFLFAVFTRADITGTVPGNEVLNDEELNDEVLEMYC
jgi:hypothetical protein